jgi:hypothetical protein
MLGLFRRPKAPDAGVADATAQPPAVPQSYAQWSECLDLLAAGQHDADCLSRMQSGRLDWTVGVAPLFVQRLGDELQRRLTMCADRMTRDLRDSTAEVQVVRTILQARAQLLFAHRLCQLPALPDNVRSQLLDEVRRFAERSQQSLLGSAQADRSGRLASVLRHNPLTRYDDPGSAAPAPGAASAAPAVAPHPPAGAQARRRNILS